LLESSAPKSKVDNMNALPVQKNSLEEEQADAQLEQTIATDAASNVAIEQKSDCGRTSCLPEFCGAGYDTVGVRWLGGHAL
jgi:hypothetical protein